MKPITMLAALAAVLATAAHAQQTQGQMPMSGSSASMQSAVNPPEACRSLAQASAQGDMMQKMQTMQGQMPQQMQSGMQGMMAQMNETQKGLHQAMMSMNGPMMMGMMNKDADVAWICAMIPHHQGAIDMARAGLKGADNEGSRKLAEETIRSQEREIAKLIAWVEQHAQRESRNETTGSTK